MYEELDLLRYKYDSVREVVTPTNNCSTRFKRYRLIQTVIVDCVAYHLPSIAAYQANVSGYRCLAVYATEELLLARDFVFCCSGLLL